MLAEKEGRHDDAIVSARKAVSIFEARLGPKHPYLGYPLTSWGISAHALGDVDEARALLERALTLRAENPTPPAERAHTELALARVLATQGESARARDLAEAARERLGNDPASARLRTEVTDWLTTGR
jgi:tetratricopeptide (TPR) repeat protein